MEEKNLDESNVPDPFIPAYRGVYPLPLTYKQQINKINNSKLLYII